MFVNTIGMQYQERWRAIPRALASNTRTTGEQYEDHRRAIPGVLAINTRTTGEQCEERWRAIPGPLASNTRSAGEQYIAIPASPCSHKYLYSESTMGFPQTTQGLSTLLPMIALTPINGPQPFIVQYVSALPTSTSIPRLHFHVLFSMCTETFGSKLTVI